MNNGNTTPSGNVVMNPDNTWNADGTRKPESEWTTVNPHNINEDCFVGKQPKGRKKFGKIFDEVAQDTIELEQKQAQELAEDTAEVDEEVAHLVADEDEDEKLGEALNLDDVGVVLQEIKILSGAAKGGDEDADNTLLTITAAEYNRPDGGRQRVKGALSALGYKKPGR